MRRALRAALLLIVAEPSCAGAARPQATAPVQSSAASPSDRDTPGDATAPDAAAPDASAPIAASDPTGPIAILPLASFREHDWGRRSGGTTPPARLGQAVELREWMCEQRERQPRGHLAAGAFPPTEFRCHAGIDPALPPAVPPGTPAPQARIRACFRVTPTASATPADIVARDLDGAITTLRERAARTRATAIYVIRTRTLQAVTSNSCSGVVGHPCDPVGPAAFIRWSFADDHVSWIEHSAEGSDLVLPRPTPADINLYIVSGAPGAERIADAARRGAWPEALRLARESVAAAGSSAPVTMLFAAQLNVATAAYFAQDARALAQATAALAAIPADSLRSVSGDVPYSAVFLGEAVHGLDWLGPDPCAGAAP